MTEVDFLKCLDELVAQAKVRVQSNTLGGKFARSRLFVRHHFQSLPFQVTVAMLLVANFFANAFEAQMYGKLVLDDGSPTQEAELLEILDQFFTIIFAVELAFNLYAHWMWDFITDGWCCFDFLVVSVSLITPFLGEADVPINIFRLMRAFRVLRIFSRLKSIRSIINALTASLVPVLNAFFIMAIVLALYAIIGVTFYADMAPEAFGNLSRSIISLFRIAAGETWIEGMPVIREGTDKVDWALGSYVISFILIVNWTLLQVRVAVLLDNFVSETSREKGAEHDLWLEEKRAKDSIGNVLDPLLKVIANEYVDAAHLTSFLAELFDFLLQVEGQTEEGELTCQHLIS